MVHQCAIAYWLKVIGLGAQCAHCVLSVTLPQWLFHSYRTSAPGAAQIFANF